MANTCFTRHWFRVLSDTHTRLWVVSLKARDGHIGGKGHHRWELSSRAVL
jgi:hypothetical protein